MKTLLLSLCLLASPGFAQVGTAKWQFRSRPEVVPALKKTRGKLRDTYDVMLCAARAGYSKSCIGYYENIVVGHEFDATPQDSAAYAFAFDLVYGARVWGWKDDLDDTQVKKSSRALALYFRDRAYKALSNSPEVLIMRSFWSFTGNGIERKNAYQMALKAVRLSPKWADGYFWLGGTTGEYLNWYLGQLSRHEVRDDAKQKERYKATIIRLAKFRLQTSDKAERLDPSLHRWLLMDRVYAYQQIPSRESAQKIPVLIDEQLKTFPAWAAYMQKRWGLSEQQYRQAWTQIANNLAKQAT